VREGRILGLALVALVLIVLLGSALGGAMMGPGAMWGPGMMWGYGQSAGWALGVGLALHWLAMLAAWGTLIVGVILLVRWLAAERPPLSTGQGQPLDILRRRYAAGEIDQPTFERMKRELEA
jgi:putative membrane protein